MIKKIVLLFVLAMSAVAGMSQTCYIPYKTFDGEHKNEASGYIMYGNNVVCNRFGGFEGSYIRHLTPRWHVGGDMQMQFVKRLYSIDIRGGYRLPIKFGNVYFTGKVMFNDYY